MKKTMTALAFSTLVASTAASGASVEAHFNGSTGTLVLPHLEVNGKIYYATLTLTDAATLTFKADFSTLTNISPPESIVPLNTSESAIVGTWSEDASVAESTYITFNSDGSYEQLQRAGDDENCADGGYETGTYSWAPGTGLLLPTVLTDENESCGLSNPRDDVPLRVFISEDSMQIIEKGGQYDDEEFFMVRIEE
jgi:hypothetical protein